MQYEPYVIIHVNDAVHDTYHLVADSSVRMNLLHMQYVITEFQNGSHVAMCMVW